MDNGKHIYINTATQISCQLPLSEAWLTAPVMHNTEYVRSSEPNFRNYFPPLVSRKMGRLMKRALVTSLEVMKRAEVTMPDAIITGTGLGCVENTEVFLSALLTQGEELLPPTPFMQSTHNTIGSHIAIYTRNNGYNATYSQKGVSFESALWDAFTQLLLGDIHTALVGCHDEVTESFHTLLKRMGYVGATGQVPCTEASVAMLVSDNAQGALCEITEVKLSRQPDATTIDRWLSDADVIMLGTNGNAANDAYYNEIAQSATQAGVRQAQYKNIFGEGYSSSALGVYALAHCLAAGEIPAHLSLMGEAIRDISNALFINHADGVNFSIIKLRRICG